MLPARCVFWHLQLGYSKERDSINQMGKMMAVREGVWVSGGRAHKAASGLVILERNQKLWKGREEIAVEGKRLGEMWNSFSFPLLLCLCECERERLCQRQQWRIWGTVRWWTIAVAAWRENACEYWMMSHRGNIGGNISAVRGELSEWTRGEFVPLTLLVVALPTLVILLHGYSHCQSIKLYLYCTCAGIETDAREIVIYNFFFF